MAYQTAQPTVRYNRRSTDRSKAAVVFYKTRMEAEIAVHLLKRCGTWAGELSVMGRESGGKAGIVGFRSDGRLIRGQRPMCDCWSRIMSTLQSSACFLVPGMGAVIAAGPVVQWTADALEIAEMGNRPGRLGDGLFSIGVPRSGAEEFEEKLESGHCAVIIHGTVDRVDRAAGMLELTDHQSMMAHECAV